MIDLNELDKAGVNSGQYKAIFTQPVLSGQQAKLVDTIQDRIHAGIESGLGDYRLYWAIDLAQETPFSQITPTLIKALLAKNLNAKETLDALAGWGLSEADLFITTDVLDESGNPTGAVRKILNPPVFFEILIPVVRAYHFAKVARLYNARDTSPLLTYAPARNTDRDRVATEIVTRMVDITSQWYGYTETLKQAIQQMLKYGVCLAFPKERWHSETQIIAGQKRTIREGLRYNLPHPTRMFYDLHHPLPTLNTDTGVEYAGYWDICRYGDLLDDPNLWNRDAIAYGGNWIDRPAYRNYFEEVYPCVLKFPNLRDPTVKREDKAAFYNVTERDMAVIRTEFFWKLCPRDWGLGDYKYPVWHRFSVASDRTVLWAEPLPYTASWFMGYDWDSAAGTPSSFSLECIPWQDHLGFLLSQMVLTAKQNLQSVVFCDMNVFQPQDIKRVEGMPERERYSKQIFIRYDGLKYRQAGVDGRQPFFTPPLQYRSIAELQSMVSTALSMMERVLQITAQETGAAAQHYQSAQEVKLIAFRADDRNRFTGSGVDSATDAWKRQLYEANMAFRDGDVEVNVKSQTPNLDAILSDIGFEIKSRGANTHLVGGNKARLNYLSFVRTNVEPGENTDPQSAQIIFQTIGIIAQNPEFLQQVGTQRIIKLLEQAAKFAGAPDDFDITQQVTEQQPGPAFLQQLQPVLQQLQQAIIQQVGEQGIAPLAQKVGQQDQHLQQIDAALKELEGIFKLASAQNDKNVLRQQELEAKLAEQQASFEAEERRKEEQHQLEMQRVRESTEAEIQSKLAKTAADIRATELKASAAKPEKES